MSTGTRITIRFASLVLVILALVYLSIYYFFYNSRIKDVQTRLVNRAVTTGRLLSQSETFDKQLIQKIDSSTTLALVDKTVAAYDAKNRETFSFADNKNDSISVDTAIFSNARANGKVFFTIDKREAVAFYYTSGNYSEVIVAAGYDKDGWANLSKLQLILVFSFLGSVLLVVIAGYFFSKSLLKPIKKIADEVNEISAQNLTRRIKPDTGNDEWTYLTDTLNELLNRMQESFQIQSRFISNASHELFNPLSAISSQLEVSMQRERQAGEYKEVIQSVYQDVLHLNQLIQTLLEFAKASGTAGGLEINLIRIDEILLKLKSEIFRLGKDYTVVLEFEELPEDETDLLILGNEKLLFTAINNIVINACKYSDDKKAIVRLHVKAKEIFITVIDTGKGIDINELENIFQPFYRTDDTKAMLGFGLGLALANRIIKLHKGFINVDSVMGKGTSFVISLPVA